MFGFVYANNIWQTANDCEKRLFKKTKNRLKTGRQCAIISERENRDSPVRIDSPSPKAVTVGNLLNYRPESRLSTPRSSARTPFSPPMARTAETEILIAKAPLSCIYFITHFKGCQILFMLQHTPEFYHCKSSYFYDLPEELIAQHPAAVRDRSRLLVCNPDRTFSDRQFSDITEYLKAGDVLVINQTKVLPVRLYGASLDVEGRRVEFLLLKRIEGKNDTWECLTRPGKKAKIGSRFAFGDKLTLTVTDVYENGNREVQFSYPENAEFFSLLDEIGEMPLPPYIREKCSDPTRYQTVYAKIPGSAAAPTAGFHFTNELIEEIKSMGVTFCPVTLNIGLGTFRPVKEENILSHPMHTESYEISSESAELINRAKSEGRRIISVGTTSCRTLEAAWDETAKKVRSGRGETDLFLYPGKKFHVIDALITNFHLPESTLLMLVSAFWGYDETMNAYRHAVKKGYRFFSFGDASLFLP